jgi:hypothetical protein
LINSQAEDGSYPQQVSCHDLAIVTIYTDMDMVPPISLNFPLEFVLSLSEFFGRKLLEFSRITACYTTLSIRMFSPYGLWQNTEKNFHFLPRSFESTYGFCTTIYIYVVVCAGKQENCEC